MLFAHDHIAQGDFFWQLTFQPFIMVVPADLGLYEALWVCVWRDSLLVE